MNRHTGYQPTLTQLFGGCNDDQDAPKDTAQKREPDKAVGPAIPPVANAESIDEDEAMEQYIVGPEPVDCVHRVQWRNGSRTSATTREASCGLSAWGGLVAVAENHHPSTSDEKKSESSPCTMSFECSFDRLFGDARDANHEDNDAGMDQLLELFQDAQIPSTQVPSFSPLDDGEPLSQPGSVGLLTPGRQSVAIEIQEGICCDKVKLSALQKSCPNWRENIVFALDQHDADVVNEALLNVKRSRERMEATKRKILEAWERQQVALDVFETALTKSLDRIVTTEDNREHFCSQDVVDGGYLTAPSPNTKKDAKLVNVMVQENLLLLSHPTSFVHTYNDVSPSHCAIVKGGNADSSRVDHLVLSY
jgi:hypothetical protein